METIKEMEELLSDEQSAPRRSPLRRSVSWTHSRMPTCRVRPLLILAVLILVTAQVTLFSVSGKPFTAVHLIDAYFLRRAK